MTNFEDKKDQSSNLEFYKRFAPFYKHFYGEIQANVVVSQWVRLLRELGYIPMAEGMADRPMKLIDIGCGPGWYLSEWSKIGFQVAGLDSSSEMLKLAEQWFLRTRPGKNCTFHQADICQSEELPESHFDLAVSHFNFLNLFAPERLPEVFAGGRHLLSKEGMWVCDFCEAEGDLAAFNEEIAFGVRGVIRRSRRHISEGEYVVHWIGDGLDFTERYWLKNTKAIIHSAKANGFSIDCFEWSPTDLSCLEDMKYSVSQLLGVFRL